MNNSEYHTLGLADKSFLVTGGAGFIGSNLVEFLLKNGAGKVRVLDDLSTGYYKNIQEFKYHQAFEFIEGDIRDLDTCKRAVKGISYVSHQAALGSVPRSINDPVTTNDVNVSGFLNMLVAAKEEKVKKFVYAASSSTYGDHPNLPKTEDVIGNPLSPYAVTKYVNELYAKVFSDLYSINSIGLRYFNIFGPRQNPNGQYAAVIPLFIRAVLDKKSPYINGDGEQTRDFTYIQNAIQANVKALLSDLSGSHVINIAFGQRTSLNDIWNAISKLENVELKPIYRDPRAGDVRDSLAAITKAKQTIGYSPEVSVMEGLKTTLAWFKNND